MFPLIRGDRDHIVFDAEPAGVGVRVGFGVDVKPCCLHSCIEEPALSKPVGMCSVLDIFSRSVLLRISFL